ncbi:hypothetical protein GCM10011317_34120 [Niveispirillum cyanobacteriorum]|nr:hypothetical protein GCM10011317_34120 [Niveispirillum cyanobacteriorum]
MTSVRGAEFLSDIALALLHRCGEEEGRVGLLANDRKAPTWHGDNRGTHARPLQPKDEIS